MQIICIQMNGHQHLIFVAPHLSGGCFADFKRLLRCNLACRKALYPVITDNLATKPEPPMYGNHFGIGVLLGAVNTAYIHLAVGLIIVFSVRKCRIQIIVQISAVGGFIGVVGIVKRCFQILVNRPKACNSHVASHSIYRFRRKRRNLTIPWMLLLPTKQALRGPR